MIRNRKGGVMGNKVRVSILLIVLLLLIPKPAFAQNYYFNLAELTADVYLNGDGTAQIDYAYTFDNQFGGDTIEFVDVSYPSYTTVNPDSILAVSNGVQLTDISESGYLGSGEGVAVGLGSESIPPGGTGTVYVRLGEVRGMIFQESTDAAYASMEFSPAYFDSSIVTGSTKITVSIHLPPGVQPEEPRWHASPSGWQEAPEAYLDDQGRITYTWQNLDARADREFQFGVSFPSSYLAEGVVRQPDVAQSLETDWSTLFNLAMFGCCFGFIGLIVFISYRSTQKRKLQYLSPKISIEGHGIKRGLTAVEAAILLEQPLDKILTMILFSVIKKSAASVATSDPLKLTVVDPIPAELLPYEIKFIQAFKAPESSRRKELQQMMIDLVSDVSGKMKGFSRKETIAFYKDIVNKAWGQVETAGTPEVKSEKFDENLEWTMLDDDYDDRTRRTFGPGPVFVPTWWPRYDPTFRPATGGTTSIPGSIGAGSGGKGLTMPTLPGSAFAGSIVTGVQNFSRNVVGNISEFTGGVTNKTNPVPVTTTRSSGGGGGSRSGGCACACACACAGCACACAGGGR